MKKLRLPRLGRLVILAGLLAVGARAGALERWFMVQENLLVDQNVANLTADDATMTFPLDGPPFQPEIGSTALPVCNSKTQAPAFEKHPPGETFPPDAGYCLGTVSCFVDMN